jgi:hypothetical protein
VKYDVHGSTKLEFDFKAVCLDKKLETSLIQIKDSNTLDCFGKKVNISNYCELKVSTDFIRGFIDKKSQKVICQSAKRIVFKYDCKSNKTYCKSVKACDFVKEKLAKSLSILHRSIIDNNLNCYFTSKSEGSIDLGLNL